MLLNTDVEIASPDYFFTFMTPGATFLDIHAMLGEGGELFPVRLELEDQNGIAGGVFPVRVTGRLMSVATNLVIDVELKNVVRGGAFVEPYLLRTGNRSTLTIHAYPQSTLVFTGGERMTLGDLRIGQDVDLKFRSFYGEPLFVDRVGIELVPETD